jgi:hypothetical protein
MDNSILVSNENYENDNERMTSIVIDVETDNSMTTIINDSMKTPLKGILKNTSDYSEQEKLLRINVIKICSILIILLIAIPLIFCDLYYGLIDVSCIYESPSYLDISLKLYLLTSGFINLLLTLIILLLLVLIKNFDEINNKTYLLTSFMLYTLCIFNLIWSIIGSIVFWEYIYYDKICKISISTYMFVSLIIKLIVSSIFIFHKKL